MGRYVFIRNSYYFGIILHEEFNSINDMVEYSQKLNSIFGTSYRYEIETLVNMKGICHYKTTPYENDNRMDYFFDQDYFQIGEMPKILNEYKSLKREESITSILKSR